MTAIRDLPPLKRLATLVRERRVELDMPKTAVATDAGITITTYNKVEAAEPVRDVTYGKVEAALGWGPGTCQHILESDDIDAPPAREGTRRDARIATIPEDDLLQAITGATVAVADNLTGAEIREFSRRVVEELRRRGLLPEE